MNECATTLLCSYARLSYSPKAPAVSNSDVTTQHMRLSNERGFAAFPILTGQALLEHHTDFASGKFYVMYTSVDLMDMQKRQWETTQD